MDLIAKTKADYNRIAGAYALTRSAERELVQFEHFVEPGRAILDWGCGNGRLVHVFKGKQARYIGVDQSEEMIAVAREEFKNEIAAGWATFEVTPGLPPWQFADANFDGIFMIASFHHLPDVESQLAILCEAQRVLKLGGFLVITTWNLTSRWAREQIGNDLWQKVGEYDFIIPWKNNRGEIVVERYYHHFEPAELISLCERADFSIKKSFWSDGVGEVSRENGKNLVIIAVKENH